MHDQLLSTSTFLTTFLGLVLALWLGLYVITRSPRSLVTWLAACTLLSLAGFFLDTLLVVNGAMEPARLLGLGWIMLPAVPAWYHLTVLLLPEPLVRVRRPLVAALYVIAVALIGLDVAFSWILAGPSGEPGILANAQRTGLAFPLFALCLVGGLGLCLDNLRRAREATVRRAIRVDVTLLLGAAALAMGGSAYGAIATGLGLPAPILPIDLSLLVAVVLFGCGIVRYNALAEGRAIRVDFMYSLLTVSLVTAGYLVAAWFSSHIFNVPFIAYVFVPVLAVVSHAMFDCVGIVLDQLFYRRQTRVLRASLRALAYEAGTSPELRSRLRVVLASVCQSLDLSQGLIALKAYADFTVEVAYRTGWIGAVIPGNILSAQQTKRLPLEEHVVCLADMVLCEPRVHDRNQVGAIGVGAKTDGGTYYSNDELEFLAEIAERLTLVIYRMKSQAEAAETINTLVAEFRMQERELQRLVHEMLAPRKTLEPPPRDGMVESEFVNLVEDALRHLYDFTYLGEHSLSRLAVVERLLSIQGGYVTVLDRGQAVKEILVDAVDQLRPAGPIPARSSATPPPREWHPYLIVQRLFFEGETHQEIMAWLYINESTFNHTYRQAVRGVAKALEEADLAAQSVPAGVLAG